jgi:hypothetical protein
VHECIQHGVSAWYERGCYTCLKVRGLAGGKLTRAEADFAGLYEPKRPSGGWHSPDLPAFEPDEPSTDDTEFLRGLMAVGQGQLEFLS